jgi:membrane associated rhomboid family serine protease
MIPLRDTREIKIFPIATILIIFINSIIFVTIYFNASAASNPSLQLATFFQHYGLVPYEITTGKGIYPSINPVWLSFISSIFLHGGWMHLIGNMLFFWIFGNNIEDYTGSIGFIFFYIIGGIVASFTQILTDPLSKVPVIGASGAIAAVMGAYFYLFPTARIKSLVFLFYFFTFVEVPAFIFLLLWFIMQLFSGFASFGSATSVAVWAHIGGFIFGFLTAVILKASRRGKERYPS